MSSNAQAPDATVETNRPRRIQRKRTAGWRMPPNTVYVGRPTKWGNPFNWRVLAAAMYSKHEIDDSVVSHLKWLSVTCFCDSVERGTCSAKYPSHEEIRRELAGKNLACWCPLDKPCHADVLLRIANGGAE